MSAVVAARRPGRVLVLVLVAVLLLAGCAVSLDTGKKSGTGAELNLQPRSNIRDGGSLTTALPEVTPQFNTFHADGSAYTRNLWRWYNPTLAYFSPDGHYSFNRDYLTDVRKEIVAGSTVVTYTMNPKAHFNDGTPIDWRAFEATWKVSNGTDPRYVVGSTDGYDRIASVTRGVDDRQAVVRFRGIWAWPDGLFNDLLHPKAVDPDVFNKGYVQKPHPEWGAGPYILSRYDPDQGIVEFTRNPQWWGHRGKLDRRVFRQMESQAAINAFRNGETDASGVGNKDALAQVITMGDIDIRTSATPQQALLLLNLKAPLLTDPRVRQAVLSGVDRATLARIRFTGLNYTEPLPGSLMLYSFQPGYADNLSGVIEYDQDKARALLDAAGWKVGADGIRHRGGTRLTLGLPMLGDDPASLNLARAFQAMLKQIGVDVDVQVRPSSDFSKVVVNQEFDMFMIGFSSGDPFGAAYMCQVWCEGSQLNRAGAGSPQLDAEIRHVATIADQQKQIAAANVVERKAFAQYSDLPLFNGPLMVAVRRGLANYGAGQFYIGPVEDVGWQK